MSAFVGGTGLLVAVPISRSAGRHRDGERGPTPDAEKPGRHGEPTGLERCLSRDGIVYLNHEVTTP